MKNTIYGIGSGLMLIASGWLSCYITIRLAMKPASSTIDWTANENLRQEGYDRAMRDIAEGRTLFGLIVVESGATLSNVTVYYLPPAGISVNTEGASNIVMQNFSVKGMERGLWMGGMISADEMSYRKEKK